VIRKQIGEKGIAFIMVLWVMALLTILVTEFAYSMRTEVRAARNFKEEAEAYYLALAGINMAIAEILSEYDFNYQGEKSGVLFAKRDGTRMPLNREFPIGDGRVSYTIIDEESKININVASRGMIWDLLRVTGIEIENRDVITDSILDWRDINQLSQLNGAEDDYYLKLAYPYEAKDGNFDTLEELLLVNGVTPEVFYGINNVPLDVFREEKKSAFSNEYSGIAEYVTTTGTGLININTASEKVLEARFGFAVANQIIAQRQAGHFQQPSYGGIVKSTSFTILSRGYAQNGPIYHEIKAIIERNTARPEIKIKYWNESI